MKGSLGRRQEGARGEMERKELWIECKMKLKVILKRYNVFVKHNSSILIEEMKEWKKTLQR